MKKSIKKIAEKSGFIFWKNENWGPGKKADKIDWSSDYNETFEKYSEDLIKKCIKICKDNQEVSAKDVSKLIKEHFKK